MGARAHSEGSTIPSAGTSEFWRFPKSGRKQCPPLVVYRGGEMCAERDRTVEDKRKRIDCVLEQFARDIAQTWSKLRRNRGVLSIRTPGQRIPT